MIFDQKSDITLLKYFDFDINVINVINVMNVINVINVAHVTRLTTYLFMIIICVINLDFIKKLYHSQCVYLNICLLQTCFLFEHYDARTGKGDCAC